MYVLFEVVSMITLVVAISVVTISTKNEAELVLIDCLLNPELGGVLLSVMFSGIIKVVVIFAFVASMSLARDLSCVEADTYWCLFKLERLSVKTCSNFPLL